MCMICIHYEADKLTAEEAFRNMNEMIRCGDIDEGHMEEIAGMILKNEMDNICDDLDIKIDELFI